MSLAPPRPRSAVPLQGPRKRARAHRTLNHQGQDKPVASPCPKLEVIPPDDRVLGEQELFCEQEGEVTCHS